MKKYNRIKNGFNEIDKATKKIADIGKELNDVQKRFNDVMGICEHLDNPPESLKKLGADLGQKLKLLTSDLNRLISYSIYYKKELLKDKRFLNEVQLNRLNGLDNEISDIGRKIGPTIHGMILELKLTALSTSAAQLLIKLRHIKSARRMLALIRRSWQSGGRVLVRIRW